VLGLRDSGGDHARLVFNAPVSVASGSEALPATIDLAADSDSLGRLGARLAGEQLVSCDSNAAAQLSVVFGNGISLTCRPDPAHEAWELEAKDLLAICGFDGSLAVWNLGNTAHGRGAEDLERRLTSLERGE
jgi:hypothetical protein